MDATERLIAAAQEARVMCFREMWRERVGRLPRCLEGDFGRLVAELDGRILYDAIIAVARLDIRRTGERLRTFYHLIGVERP